MRNNLPFKLLLAALLLAASVHADVIYTIPANSTLGAGPAISGFVDFFLSGACTTPNTTTCVLNVEISNTEPGTSGKEGITQAISGLTFTLTTASTTLTLSGASLSGTITNDGASGAVKTIKNNGQTSTTSSSGNWLAESNPGGANWGSGGLALTAITASGTKNLIVDGSSGGNSNFSGVSPSFEGPVYFQIDNITNLTTSTAVSNVALVFGTFNNAPEGDFALPSSDCTVSGPGSCSTGQIASLPEPVSFLLAGSGLLALICLRRRFRAA